MNHFADSLENGEEPSSNVRGGAKSISTYAAAWQSVETEEVFKVRNEF